MNGDAHNGDTCSFNTQHKDTKGLVQYSEIADVTQTVQQVSICESNVPSTAHTSTDNNPNDSYKDLLYHKMLERVANSDAHFKHQQRGEPDLVYEEKFNIAADVLEKNPVTFLSRFGHHLILEDLQYFSDISHKYEVSFYISDIKKYLDDKKNEMKKRNRRFEAMKQMMSDGEYFSTESMKERDPLLYDQLIGQYLTDDEIHEMVQDRDLSMSAVLMQHVQSIANSELYNKLCDIEDSQLEEEEEDDDGGGKDRQIEEEEEHMEEDTSDGNGISSQEKQMLKNEFLRTMQLRFLNGEDKQFDYKEVDENVAFDSLDIREHDEEEKYFDQSDSESLAQSCDTKSCDSSSVHMATDNKSHDIDEDYDNFIVTEDVCPGLSHDNSKYEHDSSFERKEVADDHDDEEVDSDFCKPSSISKCGVIPNGEDPHENKSLKWGEFG